MEQSNIPLINRKASYTREGTERHSITRDTEIRWKERHLVARQERAYYSSKIHPVAGHTDS